MQADITKTLQEHAVARCCRWLSCSVTLASAGHWCHVSWDQSEVIIQSSNIPGQLVTPIIHNPHTVIEHSTGDLDPVNQGRKTAKIVLPLTATGEYSTWNGQQSMEFRLKRCLLNLNILSLSWGLVHGALTDCNYNVIGKQYYSR